MVIESFLLSGVRGNSILSELNHFFYSFFAFGLTSIVTLHFVLTFFQKPLDNLFGLCYNTSCSVERSTDGNAALAQLDRVPGYEPVGRGFESLMPRHGALAGASAFFVL